MFALLQGKLSDHVMTVVTDRKQGLFPQSGEIRLGCDCPDWAVMCKHVAAVLYGVGSRLDSRPELLFLLRDVDAQELISTEMAVPSAVASGDALDDDQLGDIFGIEFDVANVTQPAPKTGQKRQRRVGRRAGSTATKKELRSALRRNPPPIAIQAIISGKARGKNAARKKPARVTTNNRTPAGEAAAPTIRPTGKSVAGLRRQLKLPAAEFAPRLDVSAAGVYRREAMIVRVEVRAGAVAALAGLVAAAHIAPPAITGRVAPGARLAVSRRTRSAAARVAKLFPVRRLPDFVSQFTPQRGVVLSPVGASVMSQWTVSVLVMCCSFSPTRY